MFLCNTSLNKMFLFASSLVALKSKFGPLKGTHLSFNAIHSVAYSGSKGHHKPHNEVGSLSPVWFVKLYKNDSHVTQCRTQSFFGHTGTCTKTN